MSSGDAELGLAEREPDDTPDAPAERSHRLAGVRLGTMQRWILCEAPGPRSLTGLANNHRDRAFRANFARAARRLKSRGLVLVVKREICSTARDGRREGLKFIAGHFGRWQDPSRAASPEQLMVWLSSFGERVTMAYRPELTHGLPIRWNPELINRLESEARDDTGWWIQHQAGLRMLTDEEHDNRFRTRQRQRTFEPALPEPQMSPAAKRRWTLVETAVAPHASTMAIDDLWDFAVSLYATESDKRLNERASQARRPNRSQAIRDSHLLGAGFLDTPQLSNANGSVGP